MSNLSSRLATKSVFSEQTPQQVGADGLSETWITRGGNFAVCVSEVQAGAVLESADNPEEYMIILPPDGVAVTIEAGGETIQADADSLTIVPPRP